MKYEPVNNWIIARALLQKVSRTITLPDSTGAKGVTRHYLIESVSPEAAEAGYKPGDMVVAKFVYDMHFFRGHRVVLQPSEMICRVTDFSLDDFVYYPDNKPVVESGNGTEITAS